MVAISTQFIIDASIIKVFDFFEDIDKVGRCISGVKDVREISPTDSEWRLEIRAGLFSQKMRLRAKVLRKNRPTSTSFKAEGQNIDISGIVSLTEKGDEKTAVIFNADIRPKGPLASLINLVTGSKQEQMINESVMNIQKEMQALKRSENK